MCACGCVHGCIFVHIYIIGFIITFSNEINIGDFKIRHISCVDNENIINYVT